MLPSFRLEKLTRIAEIPCVILKGTTYQEYIMNTGISRKKELML